MIIINSKEYIFHLLSICTFIYEAADNHIYKDCIYQRIRHEQNTAQG